MKISKRCDCSSTMDIADDAVNSKGRFIYQRKWTLKMNTLRFVVVGVGGYALEHLRAIEWLQEQGLAKLVGIVALEKDQKKYPDLIESLKSRQVEVYSDIEGFFAGRHQRADVLTVPIGIHMHVPVSIAAFEAGMHVYCEKPLAATVQEVDQLIAAQNRSDRKVAVGFQYIYSFSMQQLKARIFDGRLGPVKEISLMCGWPRSIQYYSRNDWAGQLRKNSHWILDSPANNAHAHFLLNMLYLCCSEPGQAATPRIVRAELYRANHIESPDTVQLEFRTKEGSRGNVILSHCNPYEIGPIMQLTCEKGEVKWVGDNGKAVINYENGEQEEFDNLIHPQWRYEGFKDLVQSIQANSAPLCTPQMARSHTVTVNAMHESCPQITEIPDDDVLEIEDWEMFPPDTKGDFRRVERMNEYLKQAFSEKKFLSELGISWAKRFQSQAFEIGDYSHFPQCKEISNLK